MAVTGLALYLYVLGHLFGNLQVYLGREQINRYAQLLHSHSTPLWAVRTLLFAAVLLHITVGVRLWWLGRHTARPEPYFIKADVPPAYASRTMMRSGAVILVFVVFHYMGYLLDSGDPKMWYACGGGLSAKSGRVRGALFYRGSLPGISGPAAVAGWFSVSAVWGAEGMASAWVLLQCAGCEHQSSVTAGTIFQDTRKPLTVWFRAMWAVTSQKNGASAMGLQRELGLGSYDTAWTCLHKLRRAMVRPGRDRLSGRVEVDETYWGSEEEGVRGRQTENKALIVIAAQEDGKGIGRIRMRRIPDASADSLMPFIEEAIEPGSVVHTDGWTGYDPLEGKGYPHRITFLNRQKESASELLPRVHRVASLLERWLLGTHQGAVSREHLDYYLDEFTFRFNRRNSRSRGKLLQQLAEQAVAVGPAPYRSMVKCFAQTDATNHNI